MAAVVMAAVVLVGRILAVFSTRRA
jgi:hypothetical protein